MMGSDNILGVLKGGIVGPAGCPEYPQRIFDRHRQEILQELIEMRERVNPDIVLIPSTSDTHQDHQVVTQEAFRAFKTCSILGYEAPWNNVQFKTDMFVALDERHIQKKIKAIQCYFTQCRKHYFSPEYIRSLATVRGVQIAKPYAESFEVIRWIA